VFSPSQTVRRCTLPAQIVGESAAARRSKGRVQICALASSAVFDSDSVAKGDSASPLCPPVQRCPSR
jgi:hypothetical protein